MRVHVCAALLMLYVGCVAGPAMAVDEGLRPQPPSANPTPDAIVETLSPEDGGIDVNAPSASKITIVVEGLQREVLVDYRHALDLSVHFPHDSAELTARGKRQLDRLGRALSSDDLSDHHYLVAGHTDARGPKEYNRRLSEARAQSVKDYLVRIWGVDPRRLFVHGWGEAELKYPGMPTSGVNRRVEVAMVYPASRSDHVDHKAEHGNRSDKGSVTLNVIVEEKHQEQRRKEAVSQDESIPYPQQNQVIQLPREDGCRRVLSDPRPSYLDLDDFGGYRRSLTCWPGEIAVGKDVTIEIERP